MVYAACVLALLMADDPPRQVLFSPEDPVESVIVREIMGAKKTVDLALYSLAVMQKQPRDLEEEKERYEAGDVSILDALHYAIEHGVRVRVVLDAADKGEWNPKTTAALQGIGITVWTTGATMHQKFAIVDGTTVINGSGNWSTGAFTRYTDDWIVFRGAEDVVDAFQEEFDLLLEEGRKVKRIKLPDKEKEDKE